MSVISSVCFVCKIRIYIDWNRAKNGNAIEEIYLFGPFLLKKQQSWGVMALARKPVAHPTRSLLFPRNMSSKDAVSWGQDVYSIFISLYGKQTFTDLDGPNKRRAQNHLQLNKRHRDISPNTQKHTSISVSDPSQNSPLPDFLKKVLHLCGCKMYSVY